MTPTTLPEGACYDTEQERHNEFAEHLIGTLPGTYGAVNTGSDAPEANDRGNPWARTNADGSPDGVYHFYNGSWKRKHPLDPGLIMMWAGSSASVDTIDGGTAGTATVDSGPFWEIVTAMAAKFPVGVGTFASGTAVAVAGTGGEDRVTLETKHLPESLGRFGTDVEKALGRKNAGGVALGGSGPWNFLDLPDFIKGGTTDTDKSHNNLVPYYGIFFIKRSIRQNYSI